MNPNDQASEIARLEAKITRLTAEQDQREAKWAKSFNQQIGHHAVVMYNQRRRLLLARRKDRRRLTAERDAAMEDGKRLDWLFDNGWIDISTSDVSPDGFRAAIDAARKGQS